MKTSVWPAVVLLAISVAMPAAAQTSRDVPDAGMARNVAECDAQFQRADSDGNGYLDTDETSEARGLIPTSLAGEEEISRADFMSACGDTAKRHEGNQS